MKEQLRSPRHAAIARLAVVAPFAALLAVGACNTILGEHERRLDDRDGSSAQLDATTADALVDTGPGNLDAGVDGDGGPQTITLVVPHTWTTPNGAIYGPVKGGTSILEAGTNGHAVIIPAPAIDIPADDYTLTATIIAPTRFEFGILVRGQPDGKTALYGSVYGNATPAFLGTFGPPDWNPPRTSTGPDYTFTNGTRYTMKVRAVGNQVTAKLWPAAQAEPIQWHASMIVPWTTGRGIGFYAYMTATTGLPILETMTVTVP